VDVLVGGDDPHARGGQAVALDGLDVDVQPVEVQPAQAGADVVERRAGVEQRAQQHVPGDAGDRVHVQQPRGAHRATCGRAGAVTGIASFSFPCWVMRPDRREGRR
jgi:hypothetical protein